VLIYVLLNLLEVHNAEAAAELQRSEALQLEMQAKPFVPSFVFFISFPTFVSVLPLYF
jgi:hypothetical protein